MKLKNKFFLIIFFILIIFFGIMPKVFGRNFSNFSTTNNLFCLNRGWGFSRNDSGYSEAFNFTVNGLTILPKRNISGTQYGVLTKLNEKENYVRLSYILSEIEGKKYTIGGSPYQVAIWAMLGQTDFPPTSSGHYSAAAAVLAKANAYYTYGTTDDGYGYGYGAKPKISIGENFSVYEYEGINYAGPFEVNCKSFTSGSATINRETKKNVSYGIFTKVYLNGISEGTDIYKKTENNEFEKQKINSLKNGSEFYVKVDLNIINNTIQLIQANGPVEATYRIYHSPTEAKYYSKGSAKISITGDVVTCLYCNEEMRITTNCPYCTTRGIPSYT